MTIVAPVGQYPEGLQGYGHVPGVRGGAIGTGAQIVSKLTYRGTKWLVRRLLKPKRYTYRGAVGRGIGLGTIIASQLDDFEEGIDGEIPAGPGQETYRFKQRNNRYRNTARACRYCHKRHNRKYCK